MDNLVPTGLTSAMYSANKSRPLFCRMMSEDDLSADGEVGPYLVVSLAGWALGIQGHPDSPIFHVHCQDLKKIPRPSGLVSWIGAAWPTGVPTIPVLGATMMGRTSQGSPSVAVLPPDEGAVLADVDSVRSTGSLSGSQADRPDASGVDALSAALSSAMVPFSQTILRVDVSCDLHPFFLCT